MSKQRTRVVFEKVLHLKYLSWESKQDCLARSRATICFRHTCWPILIALLTSNLGNNLPIVSVPEEPITVPTMMQPSVGAVLRRSNPVRGNYRTGEWVMVWKQGNGTLPGQWTGPMKVVVHANSKTIWTTMASKLYRCAPEHVRPVSAYEAQSIILTPWWSIHFGSS